MKIAKILIVCVTIIGPGISGCDFVYRLLDKEGAQEKALIGEVSILDNNPQVEEIQTLLRIYGYNPGKIDGIVGLRTRNMIEKFQRDNGLKPSRFVDKATWELLSTHRNNGLVVDEELNVVLIQRILEAAGFPVGGIDGKMGPRTLQAVKDFQKARGIKVDGKIGFQTLTHMSAYLTPRPQDTP